jgi:excisionase family DNA binding protein
VTPASYRERYLRSAEAAEILSVSSRTIARWAREGKLPCVRTLGNHRRFKESDIRDLYAQLLQASSST